MGRGTALSVCPPMWGSVILAILKFYEDGAPIRGDLVDIGGLEYPGGLNVLLTQVKIKSIANVCHPTAGPGLLAVATASDRASPAGPVPQ